MLRSIVILTAVIGATATPVAAQFWAPNLTGGERDCREVATRDAALAAIGIGPAGGAIWSSGQAPGALVVRVRPSALPAYMRGLAEDWPAPTTPQSMSPVIHITATKPACEAANGELHGLVFAYRRQRMWDVMAPDPAARRVAARQWFSFALNRQRCISGQSPAQFITTERQSGLVPAIDEEGAQGDPDRVTVRSGSGAKVFWRDRGACEGELPSRGFIPQHLR